MNISPVSFRGGVNPTREQLYKRMLHLSDVNYSQESICLGSIAASLNSIADSLEAKRKLDVHG